MIQLYLQLLKPLKEDDTRAFVSLESIFPLFMHRYLKLAEKVQILFVLREKIDRIGYWILLEDLEYSLEHEQESWVTACELPSLRIDNVGISGFCCVCRQLIKSTDEKSDLQLLGFRQRSLNTPSDASPWTKLCEVELPKCLHEIHFCTKESFWDIPEELLRLEMHLSLPLKVHNMPKYLRQKADNDDEVRFIDSHQLTILDIIVWISYNLIFDSIGRDNLRTKVPHTLEWFGNVEPLLEKDFGKVLSRTNIINGSKIIDCRITKEVRKSTFYKIEAKRAGVIQKYTVQKDVESALEKLSELKIDYSSKNPEGYCNNFDWKSLPTEVNPFNGDLPDKRMLRKQQQLESMAIEVVRISKPGDIIVDFCCGTGHLGILIACLLPKCQVILLDNNEESLVVRARAWVSKLKLTNVSFFLGNINYFNGNFTTGVSLHACGSATDIVLAKCWEKRANFTCSPCCYGKISETPVTKYPQSRVFREKITYDDIITIAHCADQGHEPLPGMEENDLDEQGSICTDIIDTDRKLKAEELGYKVILKRLHPESCTPKNRLLVGFVEKS
ncbi:glutathione S-transferase C-terminal domain-containing protein homolog [Culicoides brevitarsis]|uniref:glutathione S-transferase C-terminal domain-containing protein homolog n=1 Tax=Culicoides brevitarsis TaxID=469753 RepID=UPI00307BEFDA